MENETVLQMRDIRKEFPGVVALDGVHLDIKKGRVHALMGENGAGKSTLMKILNGVYQPDGGNIVLRGQKVRIPNPHTAIEMGIAMIYQELNPVPDMTIAENIFLGKEPHGPLGWVDTKRMLAETQAVLDRLDCRLSPGTKMRELTISNKQMIEIAKAVSYNADIIVMDEPTSAITENEVDKLFSVIRALKEQGVAIIYITHKMDEVFQIADEVTVLRDGQFIGTNRAEELTADTLVSMLVGRDLDEVYPKGTAVAGEELLCVEGLSRQGEFEDVSFSLRRGEILGVAGLVGAGRTELFETIAGIRRADSGTVHLAGRAVSFKTPEEAIRNKVVIATEDRKGSGLFLGLAIQENILSASYRLFFPALRVVRERLTRRIVSDEMKKFSIKASNSRQLVGTLSGGNQQKVVLSKVLLTNPGVVILDEPTRGIDVGAKSEIYRIMTTLAEQGKAVVMISSELPEILGMSDRIMVMCQGKMTGIVERSETITQEVLFNMACGEAQ